MQTRISLVLISTALTTLCGAVPFASAQEYCVTCMSPAASYRCIVESKPGAPAPATRAQLLCITELARSGNHASCSVGRTTTEPCTGETRTVMFTGAANEALPPIGDHPQETAQPRQPAAAGDGQMPPESPAAEPPKTVEELAKQTVEASGEGLKKAGEAVTDTAKSTGNAVGNAVSKTWKCVTSLFGDC
jgi:hypothetical protein